MVEKNRCVLRGLKKQRATSDKLLSSLNNMHFLEKPKFNLIIIIFVLVIIIIIIIIIKQICDIKLQSAYFLEIKSLAFFF